MTRTELLEILKALNPTEGEWEIDGYKRLFVTANKLDVAEILTPNDNDINLILLAPAMRQELLKMEEEIAKLYAGEDVRNKLSPFTNLIAMIENGLLKGTVEANRLIAQEINQCKENLKYFTVNTNPTQP